MSAATSGRLFSGAQGLHGSGVVVFRNREEAGEELAQELMRQAFEPPVVVLGIPRGGVPVAAKVAEALDAPLGVIVARKLGAPFQPELAIGAVAADGTLYLDRDIAEIAGADDDYIDKERARQAREAGLREQRFNGLRIGKIEGKTVIVVDDGIATGATAIAAVRSLKARGAGRVVLAVPVGPPDTIRRLRNEADAVICVHEVSTFFAVGQFYEEFGQVDDEDVASVLASFRASASEESEEAHAST